VSLSEDCGDHLSAKCFVYVWRRGSVEYVFFGVTVNFIGLCVVIVIIWTTVVFTCIMKDMNVD